MGTLQAEHPSPPDDGSGPAATGRDAELERLVGLLTEVDRTGAAVLVSGEAGIGKTTFANRVADRAASLGFTVLRCDGVERERAVGFGGLHQLLHPVLGALPRLSQHERATLQAVFGLADDHEGPVPEHATVDAAVLQLLQQAANDHPVLLVVEDAQWLDPSTVDVLAFVARRLARLRVVLLATRRTGESAPPDVAQFPVRNLVLGPLTDAESRRLLDRLPRPPVGRARVQVLREAHGNPLALEELSAVAPRATASTASLPLTERLEEAFTAQAKRLPGPTRDLLLVAAAGHDSPLGEVLAAAAALGLRPADLAPAEAADLVRVVDHDLQFRHPLVRSAVYSTASLEARLRVHEALAAATSDPWRAAWHRAAASPGPDEAVARALAAAADRAVHRGAQAEASTAYERAAELSVDPSARLGRMVSAAETARLAGRAGAADLAAAVSPLLVPPSDHPTLAVQAAVTRWRLTASHGGWISRLEDLVQLAEGLAGTTGADHTRERVQALVAAAVGVYVLNPDPVLRDRVRDALLDVPAGEHDADRDIASALVDPLRHAPAWRGRLGDFADAAFAPNRVASAAEAIHDLPSAVTLWTAAAERTRKAREVSEECLALQGQAQIRLLTGDLSGALAGASRAGRISADAAAFVVHGAALSTVAQARAWRGELDGAAAAVAEAHTVVGSAPVGKSAALLHWSAGLLALLEHRTWDAWVHLRQTDLHPVVAAWAVGDLTEAAVRVGKQAAAQVVVAAVEADNEVFRSPHLAMLLGRARALLTEGDAAARHFEAAVTAGRDSGAVLELARTQLAHGTWLRRRRRITAAHEPLTEAFAAFDGAGARGFAARAAPELRAAGAA
ncbi:ATP-binding protein, partial [Jatrophihabitans sp. YIM 134969]